MPLKEKQTYPNPLRHPLPEWMGKTCLALPLRRCENTGQTIRPMSTKIHQKNFFSECSLLYPSNFKNPYYHELTEKKHLQKNAHF
ncbi:hypothetical protein EZS27_006186 [termite gut metagenome]|uniref:Uncharacterized protein n=1 Tax=termite gut metagenome TaxID=433724 RepID=A0A5J4SK74_9ZZZZ